MLALTRKKGESIMIRDDIEIVILGTQGEQVKVGILAPKQVPVHRKEIYEQIQNANREAAAQAQPDLNEMKSLLFEKESLAKEAN